MLRLWWAGDIEKGEQCKKLGWARNGEAGRDAVNGAVAAVLMKCAWSCCIGEIPAAAGYAPAGIPLGIPNAGLMAPEEWSRK